MTARCYIEAFHLLPTCLIDLLQPFFEIQLTPIQIRLSPVPGGCIWMSDGRGIYVDPEAWPGINTVRFVLGISHELTHIQQRVQTGWVRWLAEIGWTVLRSLPHLRLYDHRLSPQETEALAKEREVWKALEPTFQEWYRMLDTPV